MSWRKKLRNLLEKDIRWFISLKPVPATRWKTALQQMNSEWGEDMRRQQLHIGASPVLNTCIVVLLIANTVFLGFEVDDQRTVAAGGNWFFVLLELFFATVFILEWLIRFHHQRWAFFQDNWNVFDYTLVLMGFNDSMMTLLTPLAGTQLARAFRVFRGLRVARSVRTVKRLSGLWFIIGGLLETLKTMLLVAAIAAILIFALAVALTTLVATQPWILQLWQQGSMYIGSISRSMLTILQIGTLDTWTSVARPLYDLAPFGFFTLLFSVILLNFGTFNILVAVMVERITTMATDSKELNQRACAMAEQMVLQQLLSEFRKQDEDGNGNLSLKEFKKLIRQPNLLGKLSLLGLHANEAEELFNLLDADASGEVTANELIQGIQKLKGPAKGQDMVYLISVVQKENWRATCFVNLLRRMNQRADEIQVRLNSVGTRLGRESSKNRAADVYWEKLQTEAANRDLVIAEMDQKRFTQYPILEVKVNPANYREDHNLLE